MKHVKTKEGDGLAALVAQRIRSMNHGTGNKAQAVVDVCRFLQRIHLLQSLTGYSAVKAKAVAQMKRWRDMFAGSDTAEVVSEVLDQLQPTECVCKQRLHPLFDCLRLPSAD